MRRLKAVLCACMMIMSLGVMTGCGANTDTGNTSKSDKTGTYNISSSAGGGTFKFTGNGKIKISGNSYVNGTYPCTYAGGNSYAVYDNGDLIGIVTYDSSTGKWTGDF